MKRKKLDLPGWILVILFATTLIVIVLQIICRYFFNSSLTWSEELSTFLFTWIIFIGAAVCIKDNSHIRVDFLINLFPRRLKLIAELLNLVLVIGFYGFMIVVGFMWVRESKGAVSSALSLPMNWVFYGALPVSSVLGLVYAVARIRRYIRIYQTRKRRAL